MTPLHPGRRGAALLCALWALAAALPSAAEGEPPTRRNLLLVTLDTTRADRFAAWGSQQDITPTANRLAAQGVVFERAVAAAPTTSPSHASMLSGLEPARHGVLTNRIVLPDGISTVPEKLRAAGYATAAYTSARFLLLESGLARGFEIADAPGRKRKTRAARETTKRAARWIRRQDANDSPFFAWVHYFDAHSPYELTPWAHERLTDYRGPFLGTVSVGDFGLGRWIDDPEDARAIHTRYDGLVHRADRGLAALRAALHEAGLEKRTIVIIAADHGQALGEHRVPGHDGMWEPILHVPLIIYDGSKRESRRVRERVGLVDLGPTLLELAGLEVPEGLDGRSLVPALHGEPLVERAYVSRSQKIAQKHNALTKALVDARDARLDTPRYDTAVYRGDWKILDGPSGTAIYDIARDPGEQSPVDPASSQDSVAQLRGMLEKALKVAPAASGVGQVSDETIEALRALGYAE